ncbi:lipase-like PAD4 isoform X2 [Eucalyptus grandis]|uniref:lipase-like PAD4 isoform X2 n=1 Tax=Eucalyptus grandis TaxID=71139 RepID=UPI00192ED25A|nr:lipase-like PAD4 isoform X2 [Eucalyptus grandis]XP_039157778.1 lipase-like PAD4 isoform X2 [Eucalyptus grandis]
MEAESSLFESSEMLASFLASTPFLEESWRLCSFANSTAPRSFVVDQCGEVGYLAFSGVQEIDGSYPSCGTLMPLGECGCKDLFSLLSCDSNSEGTVKVDAGFVRLFLGFYQQEDFQNQIKEFLARVKVIILTGHSFGATTASLTALWLLSRLQPIASPISVLCLTFGTPLLGNESLCRAILRERWGGSFCHVVSKHDVVPKLFFAPLTSLTPQLHLLLQFWQVAMASPILDQFVGELRKQNFDEFFGNIKACIKDAAQSEGVKNSLYWPLGSYLFCSEEGAICLDNATSVVKMMHLMLEIVSPASSFEDHRKCFLDHLKYRYYTTLLSLQFRKRININGLSESSYEAGVFLASQSLGIDPQDNNISEPAKDCLQIARHMGRAPNLNNAHLAIKLSKITPCRAQLEWYKTRCDESVDQLGYYDTFKNIAASRRESTVNMNLFRLGAFWDEVIRMAERNELSHDFHRRSKWINASHFYMLLAEPLEIARYYRRDMHKEKGHYIKHGRNSRFQILDRWWNRKVALAAQELQQNNNKMSRSRYASLTQDSLFWAKVEEAKDWLEKAEEEKDPNKLEPLLKNLNSFETYAKELDAKKELSIDVLAKKSSYTLWAEKWEAFKSKFPQPPSAPALSGMDCD